MRAIDADALMPKLKFIREAEHQIYGKESWGFASKCITAIEDAPTITPERKRGRWTYSDGTIVGVWAGYGVYCSECGEQSEYATAFCGSCGAQMWEEEP